MKHIYYLLILISILQGCNTTSKPENKLPEPGAYIHDFEKIITYDSLGENDNFLKLVILDSIITSFEARTGNEIAIVTTADVKPYTSLKDYATAIGNQWGVGKKEKNNGLVIAVSQTRREIWIATGLGTEKIITNEMCRNIIDNKMLPQFSKGKIFEGIESGLLAIIDVWEKSSNGSNSIH